MLKQSCTCRSGQSHRLVVSTSEAVLDEYFGDIVERSKLVVRQVRVDLERPVDLTINALVVCLYVPSTCNVMRIERIHVEKSVRCRKRKKEKDE